MMNAQPTATEPNRGPFLLAAVPPEVRRQAQRFAQRRQRRAWLTWTLIALTVLVFLAQQGSKAYLGVDLPLVLGAKINSALRTGEWWRLVTPIFLHLGWVHLGVNMYVLYALGPIWEQHLSRWAMLGLYVLGGVAGVAASFALIDAPSAGASGALFAYLGALVVFLVLSRSAVDTRGDLREVAQVLVINVLYSLLDARIDWAGHLGGFLGGALFAWAAGWRIDKYVLPSREQDGSFFTVNVLYMQESPRRDALGALAVVLLIGLFLALGW